ncbi:hypothetical protein RB600_010293 [Gaeumannomyces tritici]
MFYNFATQPIVPATLGLARPSVCFFLLRFAQSRPVKWAIHIAAVITALLTVVGIAQALTQCTPMAFTWDKSIVGGQCVSQTYLVISSYVSSSLSLPSSVSSRSGSSPWRPPSPRRSRSPNGASWATTCGTRPTSIWFTAEIAVAIIAGSIPCLKPLFKRILASTRRYGSGSKPPSNHVCSCGKPYMQSADASRSGGGVSKNASSHHASASRDRRSNGAALRSKGFGTDGSSSARRKAADPYSITGIDGGSDEDFEMYSPTSSGRKVPWSVVDPSLMMPGVMAVSRSHERRTSDEEVIIIQQPHSGGGRCRRRRGASRRRRTSPSLSRTPTGKRASGI